MKILRIKIVKEKVMFDIVTSLSYKTRVFKDLK